MLTMQCALKVRILLIIVVHTWYSITGIWANFHNNIPSVVQKEDVSLAMLIAHIPKEGLQIANGGIPLFKGRAHKNVIDLLRLSLGDKPMTVPSYTPFVQQVGVRINWLEILRNFWSKREKCCGGGVDLRFCGPIQFSIDAGYLSYQSTDIFYCNQLSYRSKGIYGLGALLYVLSPNYINNVYVGVAYGQSRFELVTFNTITDVSKSFVAGWIKLVGGSESRLISQLYGGMQLGISYLLHCKKHDDNRVLNYSIPGYGNVVIKIMPDMTLYLKWSISFLEKKVVI